MIRIATYNIRKCVGLDWRRRPDRVIRVLAEIDADIVALQEADRRLGRRAATLHGAAYMKTRRSTLARFRRVLLSERDRGQMCRRTPPAAPRKASPKRSRVAGSGTCRTVMRDT